MRVLGFGVTTYPLSRGTMFMNRSCLQLLGRACVRRPLKVAMSSPTVYGVGFRGLGS